MLAILNSLNAHTFLIFQLILMVLVSKFMVHRALSDKAYLKLGLLSPLKHILSTLKFATRAWFTYIHERQSKFSNSWGFYFHGTSHMRSFAKIKPSRKIPNLQCWLFTVPFYNPTKRLILYNYWLQWGRHQDLSTRKSDNSPRPPGRGEYHF